MKTKTWLVAALVVALSGAGGWWLAKSRSAPHRHLLEKRVDARGATYYTCPMHPQVRLDAPGQCPICGMTLVKRTDGAEAPADPATPLVQVAPGAMQALGIRTAAVERGEVTPRVEAVGSVALDERRIVTVESRAAGWIEKLEVRAEGDVVRKGQVLARLYAPELFAAQQELKLAKAGGDATLTRAAEQRLRLLGGSIGDERSAVTAPASGFVVELMAREGAQLSPGMPLMKIADLSQVWVLAEVPEAAAGSVRPDAKAVARFASLPGRTFEGRVDYVYPQLEPVTRSLKIRLVFDNADAVLSPGMFANVSFAGEARPGVVTVPTEAVIRTGRRAVVMVSEGSGRYRPVRVETGAERGDRIEIVSGLEPGQQVVVSGQFLIDSEASLLGAYSRMDGAPQDGPGDMRSIGGAP